MGVLHRAYSVLEVKAVDGDKRVITGIATTPQVDRVGDVVEPKGAVFKNPLPLLLYHDSRLPVGEARFGTPTDEGIPFTATFPEIAEPGTLQDRVSEAWQSVKAKLIRGVSIGFRALPDGVELMRSGGYRFLKTEILELSLVAIPANADATIHTIKSADQAKPGQVADVRAYVGRPGVSGAVVRLAQKDAPTTMKTIAEQISAFEATRETKQARMTELMQKASEEGVTLDQTQTEEYDGLTNEVRSINEHIGRLRDLDEVNKAAAKPVVGKTIEEGTRSRAPQAVISVKDNRPAGIGFARVAIAKVAARLEGCTVSEIVKQRWPSDAGLQAYFQKAAVPAGTTLDPVWAAPLVDPANLESEFIEYLRPRTIIGRIPGLRRVPFNVRVTGQSSGATAQWVGQGKGKPVTSFQTTAQTLLYTKIAAIAVITEELARFSSPSAEALVRDELARAVIERMDVDFIDPAAAAVSNVSPASITNGVVALGSSGTAEANIRTDLTLLLSTFIQQNVDPTNLVLIMPNTLALAASLMVNSLGQPSFPGITASGGTLLGIPVVASQYAANASGYGNLVIALNASDIFLADDGQVRLDASREASIQMSDAPTLDSSTGTGASMVSMYQTNSIAIRAERYINWAKVRSNAVVYMDDVNWGSVGSPS